MAHMTEIKRTPLGKVISEIKVFEQEDSIQRFGKIILGGEFFACGYLPIGENVCNVTIMDSKHAREHGVAGKLLFKHPLSAIFDVTFPLFLHIVQSGF